VVVQGGEQRGVGIELLAGGVWRDGIGDVEEALGVGECALRGVVEDGDGSGRVPWQRGQAGPKRQSQDGAAYEAVEDQASKLMLWHMPPQVISYTAAISSSLFLPSL